MKILIALVLTALLYLCPILFYFGIAYWLLCGFRISKKGNLINVGYWCIANLVLMALLVITSMHPPFNTWLVAWAHYVILETARKVLGYGMPAVLVLGGIANLCSRNPKTRAPIGRAPPLPSLPSESITLNGNRLLSLIASVCNVAFGLLLYRRQMHTAHQPSIYSLLIVIALIIIAAGMIWFADDLPKNERTPSDPPYGWLLGWNMNVESKGYLIVGWVILVCFIPSGIWLIFNAWK